MVNESNENIVSKINKLFALADSNNEHEAALALKNAHKLMMKYKIEQEDLKGEEKLNTATDEDMTEYSGRTAWWLKSLAATIADAFQCQAILKHGYKQTKLAVLGRKEDIYAVQTTFNYARLFILNQRQAINKRHTDLSTKQKSAKRNTWIDGFIWGLKAGFEQTMQSMALVPVMSEEVLALIEDRKLRKGNNSGIRPNQSNDRGDYDDGFKTGKNFSDNTNRKVGYKTAEKDRQLES